MRTLALLLDCGEQTAALFEEAAIAHRHIALGRQVVGDENVVAVEFDVPITDLVDLDLGNGRAVDQMADGDEDLANEIDADRMAGREVQVLRGPAGPRASAAIRTGKAGRGSGWRRKSRSRWPIHLTGRSSPEAVTTRSPILSVSTGTSPAGVRMSVPAAKQGSAGVMGVMARHEVVVVIKRRGNRRRGRPAHGHIAGAERRRLLAALRGAL